MNRIVTGKEKRRIYGAMTAIVCSLMLSACGNKEPVLIEAATQESIEPEAASTEGMTQDIKVDNATEKAEAATESSRCCIHICGAVQQPGVYFLEAGARIYDAVKEAGGFSENASTEYWNQAELLQDGQQIRVPTREEVATGIVQNPQKQDKTSEDAGLVNINTADETLLCTLPGIGALKAANIIAYREQKGGFTSIDDMLQVEGIKEGTFNKIRDKITV